MKRSVLDQLNRTVSITYEPQRIVSLVPSQTELLFDLGAGARVVGVTRYCCYPKDRPFGIVEVGGTKNVDQGRVLALEPDLVIANKEENSRSDINALSESFPVWVSDVDTLESALAMIASIGKLLDVQWQAQHLIKTIKQKFLALEGLNESTRSIKMAAYMIWRKPYMVAAGGTFINDVMRYSGFENVFASERRYPSVSLERLRKASPEYILLSSEPYPFIDKHIEEFQQMLPSANIVLVDGEYFSWYGSRLQYAAEYFNRLQMRIE